ncbi:MAG: holo-[acyl-carrier-protein] synthase [Clostridiales bacterium]|nr:holo-[acyl-carrier-protein] synthase [Clostridiales bacterium]
MIGIDIENISRFDHWTEEGLKRIFSENEIEYINQFENKSERICGFFCAKEAFVKALDDTNIIYSQIEILHTESGKPYINKTKYIESILKEHFVSRIDVSISHCKDFATAVVLID